MGTGSGTCTESALNACLPGGGTFDGTVTFNCGGAATITVTSYKSISAATTIDGGSLVTISGGNSWGLFLVANAVNFTVQNLNIASGNGALTGFGGIYNGGTLTVTNSTFSGNSATGGGGIMNNGTLTVTNSTFSGNSGGLYGGGVIYNVASTTVTVTNTIVANSTSGSNCAGNAVTDGGHNIDDGTTCGFTGTGCTTTSGSSFCNTNPLLDPAGLAGNGGPTQTIALQAGSPAINAGDETVCSTTTGTAPVDNLDQRRFVRPGTGAANCSIGAFEANSCPSMPDNTCFSAGKSSVSFKDNTDTTKRKFSWKWSKGTVPLMQADFGDPVNGTTSYTLCVYDQDGGAPVFKMGASVVAGGMCGTKPCWKAVSDKGWAYKNKGGNGEGITKAQLKGGGAGKPQVQVQAKGTSLPMPAPVSGTQFFDQDPAVIVQLHSSSPVHCWSSTFDSSKKNDGTQFKAVSP